MVNCELDVKVKDWEGAQGHYQPLSKALCLSSVNLAHISSDHEQVLEREFLNDIILNIMVKGYFFLLNVFSHLTGSLFQYQNDHWDLLF